MTRLLRMAPIQRLAEEREREAARTFAETRIRLSEQQARMQQLRDYRNEYSNRFQHSGGGGMTPRQLGEYRAFLERLDRGLRHQQDVLAKADAEVVQARQDWTEAIRHRDRLEVMRTRIRCEERTLADRREQRESDERAGRVLRLSLD